jgi:hypothetical protein
MNPYFPGTLFGLGLLFPSHAQGVMLPRGDERFQENQHRAALAALRLLGGAAILIAFADYGGWWQIPVVVSVAAALTLSATLYNLLLWQAERSEA